MTELTDETVRADLVEQAATIVARYPEGRSRSALLPMLHLVQSVDGYVSPAGIAFCAEQLGITKAEVAAVATFYTMYKRRPTGEYLVSVCTNTMCGVLGGDKAYEALSEYLEVGHDQTTEDGRITLEHAECLAACDYAPVMTVNYEYFDQIDADSALTLVKQLQDGERPVPSRGARLCSFKQISRELAGFSDDRSAVADPMNGIEPTVAGNRVAEERRVSVPGYYPNTPIPKKADQDAKSAPAKAAPAKAAPAAAAPAPAAAAPAAAPAEAAASPAAKAAAATTSDEGPKTAEPAGDAAAPKTPRRRSSGPLVSATADPAKRRPAKRTPGTERSAPAVAQAPAQPAQATTDPQVKDVETPENPAETSPTVPEPAADSKPAGDAPPADPRNQNEGQK
ncbi:hypothetical protein GCM10009539_14710 [Cryptosporangium japonicum]|uniref:NADH dehydrogenase subunit E n=1 Tax=Cryptosporangium japonicum TaxID=80872 RepID=A0ABN0TUC4_9ACTN